jgi:excisionase family DNA binding protein
MADEMLDIKECAAMLKVSVRTVWRMVRDKQIPVTWVRESMRFEWEKVKAALPSERPRLLPDRVQPIRRGVSSLTEHLKRKVESWPTK